MLFKKYLNILKSKKGFTLLEVIVASAVSCIVLMCAIGFFVPMMNSTRTNQELADAKNSSARIIEYIQRKVQYNSSIQVESTTSVTNTGVNTIYQQRNPVDPTDPKKSDLLVTYFTNTGNPADGVDILGGQGFYSNMDFIITYKQAEDRSVIPPVSKNAIEVTVTVMRKKQSKVIYKITETIYLFNGGVVNTAGANPTPAADEFQLIKF